MSKKSAAKKKITCSICSRIPEKDSEFWVGGQLRTTPLVKAVSQLEIVGAPYFNDDTLHSHSCLKRCPECGAIYKWEFEYEYLVGGSEDTITLTRLGTEEGNLAVEEVMKTVEIMKQKFYSKAKKKIKNLRTSTDDAIIKDAIDFFHYHQLIYDEDISFAVDALREILIRYSSKSLNREEEEILYWLNSVLVNYIIKRKPEHKDLIRQHINDSSKTLALKILEVLGSSSVKPSSSEEP